MKIASQHIFKNSLPYEFSPGKIHYQLLPDELVAQTVASGQGVLSDTGALCIATGAFTGRCPQDKFIVQDALTAPHIDWNKFNIPIAEDFFFSLKSKMLRYLSAKAVWIRDMYACADTAYQLPVRVINENAWSNLFCYTMFLRPDDKALPAFKPEWHIIQAPGFKANPAVDGTRSEHFAIISFKQKTILIGGTGYTGEMKKGIFTVLNYLLPQNEQVLSMHCSANIGSQGDTAIFFGLSGTGKTTLSADPSRRLVGDDEHGWTKDTVFNFEGGCYAKIIDLTKEKEPSIYAAIKEGALVENVTFLPDSNTIDFASKAITENTRVSYPLQYIPDAIAPSISHSPQNIFFLTCDAYGVLPPVSRLSPAQAMYHFISGYTAKIAGTENGITEPKVTFSACFGAPFLPLHPARYAALLGNKLKAGTVAVWLINTGWTGGAYGTGKRIALRDTRAIIDAVLNGKLNKVDYDEEELFGLAIPQTCPGIDDTILNPRNTWVNKAAYDEMAAELAFRFRKNFEQYAGGVSSEIANAAPMIPAQQF